MKQLYANIFFLLLILFAGLNLKAKAQFYHFSQYSLEQGLPQSEVLTIAEDHLGYLWVGTNGGGLCRFNGKSFDVFTRKNGLHENIIVGLYLDNNFDLWIGSPGAILRYNGKIFEKIFVSDTTFFTNEIKFYETSGGTIWVHANLANGNRGFFKIENDSLVNSGSLFEELKDKSVLYVTQVNSNHLIITTDKGQYDLMSGKLEPSTVFPASDKKIYVPLVVDRNNDIWTLTFNLDDHSRELQIFRSGKYMKDVKLPKGANVYNIFDSYQDREGGIWLSLFDFGVIRYINGKWKVFTEENGLPINSVRTIHEDPEGNFWFGTLGAGLVRYSGDLFITFDTRSGLSDDIVRSIYQDSKGNYYFGVNGGGLNIYDGKKMRVDYLKGNKGAGYISSMYEVRPGVLLLATFAGLVEYDGHNFRPCGKDYGIKKPYPVMDIEAKGDTLFFAVYDLGIVKSINGKAENYNYSNSEYNSRITTSLFVDSHKNVWICSDKGIWLYNGGLVNINKKYGLAVYYILQAAEDKTGNIWFATYTDGLLKFDGDTFTVVDASAGLTSDNIYSVICDDDGNIWAGTQNGVDKLTIDNSGNIASIENFGRYDGFTGMENNGNANYKDHNGNLWFGTIKGAIKYNPSKRNINYLPPPVYIKDIRIGFKKINWNSPPLYAKFDSVSSWFGMPVGLSLPHDKNHLSFTFDGLCYTVPEKVKYKWKLEPLEKEYSPAGKMNRAIYSSLPPGNYTFYVKACNNSGIWNNTPAVYSFEIRPAWWQTTILKVIIVLFVLILSFHIYRMRRSRRHMFRHEMETLLESKSTELKQQKEVIDGKEKQISILEKEKVTLSAELESCRDSIKSLAGIGETALSGVSPEEAFMQVYGELQKVMDVCLFGIGELNEKDKTLEFKSLIIQKERVPYLKFTLDDKDRLSVFSVLDKKEVFAKDITKEYKNYVKELKPLPGDINPRSVIFIPVIFRGKTLGVLTVQSPKVGVYDERHMDIVRVVVDLISTLLQKRS